MRTKQMIGLIVLGCIAASLGVLAWLIAWLGHCRGLVVGLPHRAGVIGTYLVVVGPRQRRWGATQEEVDRGMPGDALLRAGCSLHDASDHDRRTTGGRLPVVAADRLWTGRLVQLRLDR